MVSAWLKLNSKIILRLWLYFPLIHDSSFFLSFIDFEKCNKAKLRCDLFPLKCLQLLLPFHNCQLLSQMNTFCNKKLSNFLPVNQFSTKAVRQRFKRNLYLFDIYFHLFYMFFLSIWFYVLSIWYLFLCIWCLGVVNFDGWLFWINTYDIILQGNVNNKLGLSWAKLSSSWT